MMLLRARTPCLAVSATRRSRPVTVVRSLPSTEDPRAPHPSALQPTHPWPEVDEEFEVTHDAFHKAFDDSKPFRIAVPGLQEFAAAIWSRRRIPSGSIEQDPLIHIFDEFDIDEDGTLKPPEIAAALQSRGVKVSPSEISWFIDEFEEGREPLIHRHEWPEFVYSMAVADAHAKEGSSSSTDQY